MDWFQFIPFEWFAIIYLMLLTGVEVYFHGNIKKIVKNIVQEELNKIEEENKG